MRTAAAYLRVSTEKQDEYSLDSQLKLIRDYAAGHDFIVPDEFVFTDDGISGRSAKKRPAFNRMIGYAKEKDRPFEAILVWKFSRFARNQEESIVYKSMLARSGVEVISVSEPLAEGPFGSLIERIMEWMDEYYSIRLSGEVKRGMEEKISRGEAGYSPPYGYKVEGKRFVPDPEQAETVRRVFRDYLAGVGMLTIARQLAAEGVHTKFGHAPDNRFVEYMLKNPTYIGKLRWSHDGRGMYERSSEANEHAYLADGQHEPIIDLDLWDAVQAKLEQAEKGRRKWQRRDQPVEFMLKGLVRCSSCGSTLVYAGSSCPFLQCHKYSHGKCGTSHALSVSKANRLITEYLKSAAESMVFPVSPHAEKSRSGPDYDHLISVEQVKLRRVQEAYESGIDSLEEYARKKRRLLEGISDLEAKAAAASEEARAAQLDPLEFREKVLHVLDVIQSPDATEAAKGEALRSVVSYIVYNKPAQRLEVYFYT